MRIGLALGRLGEFIAYQFLRQKGTVVFAARWDFELDGRPIEVKTAVEHYYNKDKLSRYCCGLFNAQQQDRHALLCKHHGLYCFVLLKDDGFAAVKLIDADSIKLTWWSQISWTKVFRYKKVCNKKICTEPSFMPWRPFLSRYVLNEMKK